MLRLKMLLAGACAAALNINAFANERPAKEPITFTRAGKTYRCTPVEPVENNTPQKKGEQIERAFQLQKRVKLTDFDLAKNFDDVLYVHDFGENKYAVFASYKIWFLWIKHEENYEKSDEPKEFGLLHVKRISEYDQRTCGPKKSDEKVRDVYVVSDSIVLAVTTKNRIFKVEKTAKKLDCISSRVIKKDDDNICVYREDDGSLRFILYAPEDREAGQP